MDKSDRDISQWDARLKQQLERSFHNYHKRRIDLSVARDSKQFDWTGETLIVEKASSADAIATVRLMFEDADELDLQENIEIKSIFNRLYISNDAQADEWLDVIAGINFEYKKKIVGDKFIQRVNPSIPDFTQDDFIWDAAFYTKELPTFVPANAKRFLMRLEIRGSLPEMYLMLYPANSTNHTDGQSVRTAVANVTAIGTLVLTITTPRTIQYKAKDDGGEITHLDLTILGWFV